MPGERIIQIKAKPNAKSSKVVESEDGIWLVHLKASPVDGKANKELIATLSTYLGVRKADISIKTGQSSRLKRIEIKSSD